jgi:tRNA A37 threonylcarbamoyladenosine dehydratase
MIYNTSSLFPNKVYIHGCGGTGSRLVPLVAQFLKSLPHVINPEIVLFDFDTVEAKNLSRQNFVTSDVGKYKSEVLAARYAKAYDINIKAETTSITDSQSNTMEYGEVALHILCVDSVSSRKDIQAWISANSVVGIIIDTGNGDNYGQVKVMGTSSPSACQASGEILEKLISNKSVPFSVRVPSLYMDVDYFNQMVETTSTASCADLDQTMAINVLVAATAFSVVQNIYYAKDIDYHRIDIGLDSGCIYRHTDFKYLRELVSQDSWQSGYTLPGSNIDTLMKIASIEFDKAILLAA